MCLMMSCVSFYGVGLSPGTKINPSTELGTVPRMAVSSLLFLCACILSCAGSMGGGGLDLFRDILRRLWTWRNFPMRCTMGHSLSCRVAVAEVNDSCCLRLDLSELCLVKCGRLLR